MPAGALDGDVTLEVTFHADRISARRRQLCRVNDGSTTDMSGAGPMASLARNAIIGKDRLGVAVLRAVQGRLHTARVALQATWHGGKIQRDLFHALLGRGHVPNMLVRIPVYG